MQTTRRNISLVIIIFFILFTMTSFRGKMGKFGNALDKPGIQRATAWIGLLGFLIGEYDGFRKMTRALTRV